MELLVSKTPAFGGVVSSPPSKSYTHRAIILAGLSDGSVEVKNPLLSADPFATIGAMRLAGARVDVKETELFVVGNKGIIRAPRLVDVGNSGTTLRIMTSVFSLCNNRVILTGDESIQKRPMGPLLDALNGVGVKTTSKNGTPPISVRGPMQGRDIKIRGDISSQYISGLLIACPLREEDTHIEITTPISSRPYLDITLDIIKDFGGSVESHDYQSFDITGGQSYRRRKYTVEGDYSGAAFILGAAAVTGSEVQVDGLVSDSKQGDKFFLKILSDMGARVIQKKSSVIVRGGELNALDLDLSQTPDLLPITAVLSAYAKGTTTIRNVEHARVKECDRISATANGLKKMGVSVEERKDGMVIHGTSHLKGARIESFGDHRMVMAFAVAALGATGKTIISGAESIKISYPKFIEDMKRLGANIQLL